MMISDINLLKQRTLEVFRHKEIYFYFATLVLLLISSFNIFFSVFLFFLVIFYSIFSGEEQSLKMLLFLNPFQFVIQKIIFYLNIFVIFIIFVKELISDIKNKNIKFKLSYLFQLAFVLYLIFSNLLPLNFYPFFEFIGLFLLLWILEKKKNEFNFLNLLKYFMWGMIVSYAFGALRGCSLLLQNGNVQITQVYGDIEITRIAGLFIHPNTMAVYAVGVTSVLLYLKIEEKIGKEFYFYFTLESIFGYLTCSRTFLYAFIVEIIVFVVLEIIKEKRYFFKKVYPTILILIGIALVFYKYTFVNIERFSENLKDLFFGYNNSVNLPIDELNKIDDPGRGGLLKKYYYDWTSSINSFLFGRGFLEPALGGYSSHNTYMELIWKIGLIGLCLLIAVTCVGIYEKLKGIKIKQIFKNSFIYVCLIPVSMGLFVECFLSGFYSFYLIIIIYLALYTKKQYQSSEISQTKEIEMNSPEPNTEKTNEEVNLNDKKITD